MKKLALAIVTTALLIGAAPAMAAGIYVGPGGIGIGPGPGPYYGRCGDWNNWCNGYYDNGYYDYYGGPDVVIGGGGWHGHPHFHGHWHH